MAKVTINGIPVKVKKGTTILKAAESIGVQIPTLCFLEEINEIGFCRVCVVEVEGEQDLVSSCNTEVTNGMVIETESEKVLEARKTTLALLASRHRFDCWRCPKDGNCEFYDLLKANDVVFEEFGPGIGRSDELIFGSGISQDQSKCVLCKKCVAVCSEVVTAKVLKFRDDDGTNPFVSPTVGLDFDDAGCIFCGQCVKVCPTGTLFETDHTKKVESLLRDPEKTVYVQVAPAVRASLAEEFGYDIGTPVKEIQGKMYEALQLLGFDEVTDTNFAADLTIMEEGTELINRIQNGGTLPLFTSCCPAWVRYAEMYQPDYLDHLSSAKSPHMMQGALIKAYYGPKYKEVKPENIAVVSIMPCTAKKAEIARPEMEVDGIRDVDAVLTVRELAKMIKRKNINFKKLEGITLDNPLSKFSGAGTIFGNSGGVAEAALRTIYETLEGTPLETLEFKEVRGATFEKYEGMIKEATITLPTTKLKVNIAVVHGGAAIKRIFEILESGKKQYHFIEFMACPGGCVNGGGTPFTHDINFKDVIKLRSESLYEQDQFDTEIRKSHENEDVLKLYEDYLGEANSEVAHSLLHTHYSKREFTKE
jgi:iron-only hydrogenase group A